MLDVVGLDFVGVVDVVGGELFGIWRAERGHAGVALVNGLFGGYRLAEAIYLVWLLIMVIIMIYALVRFDICVCGSRC